MSKKNTNKNSARVPLSIAFRELAEDLLCNHYDIKDLVRMLYNHDLPARMLLVLIFVLTLEENTDLFGLSEIQQMKNLKKLHLSNQMKPKDTQSKSPKETDI